MTIALPNPFQFESAVHASPAETLAAHVDHAAVLSIPVLRASPAGSQEVVVSTGQAGATTSKSESQAKATEGKAGMAGVTGPVRRSTAGTGLRVGEASADLPATSEFMGVTARRDEQPFFTIGHISAPIPSAEITAELEAGIAAIVAGVARKRSHIALRSFASNSITSFSRS